MSFGIFSSIFFSPILSCPSLCPHIVSYRSPEPHTVISNIFSSLLSLAPNTILLLLSNALIAGSKDGTVWMWLAHNGQCVQVFAGHDGGVTCGKHGYLYHGNLLLPWWLSYGRADLFFPFVFCWWEMICDMIWYDMVMSHTSFLHVMQCHVFLF